MPGNSTPPRRSKATWCPEPEPTESVAEPSVEPPESSNALATQGEVTVIKRSAREEAMDRIAGLEDQVFLEQIEILKDSAYFTHLDPSDAPTAAAQRESVLAGWVDEFNGDVSRANRRYRTAMANWQSSKDAPIGVRHAAAIFLGILKARRDMSDKAPPTLGIALVELPTPGQGLRQIEVQE